MIELGRLVAILQELAPTELSDLHDTPCFSKKYQEKVEKIGVCVDPTAENIRTASDRGVQLLLSHHQWLGEAVEVVEEKELSLYYLHSAWNRAPEGNTSTLARLLNLENPMLGEDVVKGETDMTLRELIGCCQRILEVNILPYIGDLPGLVKKIIISSGPGFSPLNKEAWQGWLAEGCDTIISSELGRYAAAYLGGKGVNLIDAGHSLMAKPGMKHLAYLLQSKLKIYQCEVEFFSDLYDVHYQTGSFYHTFGAQESAKGEEGIQK